MCVSGLLDNSSWSNDIGDMSKIHYVMLQGITNNELKLYSLLLGHAKSKNGASS